MKIKLPLQCEREGHWFLLRIDKKIMDAATGGFCEHNQQMALLDQ